MGSCSKTASSSLGTSSSGSSSSKEGSVCCLCKSYAVSDIIHLNSIMKY
jgi:hypothetical protein